MSHRPDRLPGLSHAASAVVMSYAEDAFPDWDGTAGRPRVLLLIDGLRLSLRRLRRNATYQDLAADFGVAVSTAWAYHQLMVGLLAEVLGCHPDELDVLVAGKVCLVDGTLVPTFNWRHRRDLFSGKHRRYGVNRQLAADLHGRLVGVSPAHLGSWHDTRCFRAAGWGSLLAGAGGGIGNLGYEGTRLITPKKSRLSRSAYRARLRSAPLSLS